MRAALDKLQVARSQACIIGDRLDTDILAGIQSEIRTVLVLSGVTSMADVHLCAFRPDCILPSVGAILEDGVEQNEDTWMAQQQAAHQAMLAAAAAKKSSAAATPAKGQQSANKN
jgi:hypothetical protein